jgi:flavin-binding protein dodecin
MAKIVKVIEVMSESGNSWEEAAQNVVSEASKTLRKFALFTSRNSPPESRMTRSRAIA